MRIPSGPCLRADRYHADLPKQKQNDTPWSILLQLGPNVHHFGHCTQTRPASIILIPDGGEPDGDLSLIARYGATMLVTRISSLATREDRPSRQVITDALRVLDWTNLDSAPAMTDIDALTVLSDGERQARFAILVNTPRMLRAATAFAEQAGMYGFYVRVFVSGDEALAWVRRTVPAVFATGQ